jgi:hypothetical protein
MKSKLLNTHGDIGSDEQSQQTFREENRDSLDFVDLNALFAKRDEIPGVTIVIAGSDGSKWLISREVLLNRADDHFWEVNMMSGESVSYAECFSQAAGEELASTLLAICT